MAQLSDFSLKNLALMAYVLLSNYTFSLPPLTLKNWYPLPFHPHLLAVEQLRMQNLRLIASLLWQKLQTRPATLFLARTKTNRPTIELNHHLRLDRKPLGSNLPHLVHEPAHYSLLFFFLTKIFLSGTGFGIFGGLFFNIFFCSVCA
jgi:hypothetical protein